MATIKRQAPLLYDFCTMNKNFFLAAC